MTAGLVSAVPASATTTTDGNWWYTAYGVDAVHAEGWTGDGVTIAVIDGQINPDLPDFADADITVSDTTGCTNIPAETTEYSLSSSHGSTSVGLLVANGTGPSGLRGIVPDARIIFYSNPTDEACDPNPAIAAADSDPAMWMIGQALDDGADIISVSQNGGSPDGSATVARAIAEQVPIVAGVTNDALNHGGGVPSSLRGVVSVNAVDANQRFLTTSTGLENAVFDTTIVAPGNGVAVLGANGSWDEFELADGSSHATPLVAGILAAAMQKYPDATGNQLLQSLARNTGPEDHELSYDERGGYGFGVASLQHVLRTDPSGYPDENIFLEHGAEVPDDEALAAAMAAVEATPPASDAPDAPDPGAADDGIAGIVLVVSIVGIVILAAVIILTIVLVRRSKNAHREGQS